MGDCTKVHSLALKDEFEKASTRRDYGYEEEVLEFLKDFIKENERKIEVAKKRIENVEDNPELEKMVKMKLHVHMYMYLSQCVDNLLNKCPNHCFHVHVILFFPHRLKIYMSWQSR